MSTKNEGLAITPKTIIDDVLSKIAKFKESGELTMPIDYSPENALKSAYLILSETVDKQKNPVLQSCTPISIANTLLDMVVQGLSPMKNQCYFIAYADKLQLSRSYLGSMAMAKRVGMKDIVANVVYEKDVFNYQIDSKTGLLSILEHKQELINIDITKIRGAYTITTMQDGTSNLTVMTMPQIQLSWMQGYAKGQSGAHTNFTDEMCKKTVINRACKIIINSSTDAMLTSNTIEDFDEIQEANVVSSTKSTENQIEVKIEVEKPETVEIEKPKPTNKPKRDF